MTNASTGNFVQAFDRASDGTLKLGGSFSTGGSGTGGGLGNQGALALNEDRSLLFVVNPASDTFTVFQVTGSTLTLKTTIASGGRRPISIAERKGLVYVLNLGSDAGVTDNISGFHVGVDGTIAPIPGSTRLLSAPATRAAQVAISPSGVIVVTERGTAKIDTYIVDGNGVASMPIVNQSSGTVPFGFDFHGTDQVLVSEEGPGAASSYSLSSAGVLQAISASVANSQGAVCWLVVTPDQRFAYTGNTTSKTISGYVVATNGTLTLLRTDGNNASTSDNVIDLAVSPDSQFLYAIARGKGIDVFRIAADGSLQFLQTAVQAQANGLVVR